MRQLAIDPGYANCGWVVMEDLQILKFGAWLTNNDWKRMSIQQRSLEIAHGLQSIAMTYDVDFVSTEGFFIGKGPRIIYDRGRHDAYVELALGHLDVWKVNPQSLKKFVTGNGRADKSDMQDALLAFMSEHSPEMYQSLQAVFRNPTEYEHVLEAYGIGQIGRVSWMVENGIKDGLTKSQIELGRRMRSNFAPAFLYSPCSLPLPKH